MSSDNIDKYSNENKRLKQDLLVAAEAGQNLLEKNKQLKEKVFDYELIKQELEKSQQESHRLRQKLRLSELTAVDEKEEKKEIIQTLVRERTQEKLDVKRVKEKLRNEKNELMTALKIERCKSDMIVGRGMKPYNPMTRNQKLQKGGSRNTNALSLHQPNPQLRRKTMSTKIKPITEQEEAPTGRFRSNSKNTKNIEALLSMADVVDETHKQKELELENEKYKSQINKLETENKVLRRKVAEMNEEITGYKMYVEMTEKEITDKDIEISKLTEDINNYEIQLIEKRYEESQIPNVKDTSLGQESGIDGMSDDPIPNSASLGASLADELKDLDGPNMLLVREKTSADILHEREKSKFKQSMLMQQNNNEIKDQIDVGISILMDIFKKNDFQLPDNQKLGQEEVSSESYNLVALLLLLKELILKENSDLNLLNNKTDENALESFNNQAEIKTLKETLGRIKTELELSQEQLIDIIKQKLKYQCEAEAWQEDMEVMVAENIKLCHAISKRDDAYDRLRQTTESTQNMNNLRLGNWLKSKLNNLNLDLNLSLDKK